MTGKLNMAGFMPAANGARPVWQAGALAASSQPGREIKILLRGLGVFICAFAILAQASWSDRSTRLSAGPVRLQSLVVSPAAAEAGQAVKSAARVEPVMPRAAIAAAAQPAGSFFADVTAPAGGAQVTETFTAVEVVDAQTLKAGGLLVKLTGANLPERDSFCRRIDGRVEPCWDRAATQLELATRFKSVVCAFEKASETLAVGDCRAGNTDLAKAASRLTRV